MRFLALAFAMFVLNCGAEEEKERLPDPIFAMGTYDMFGVAATDECFGQFSYGARFVIKYDEGTNKYTMGEANNVIELTRIENDELFYHGDREGTYDVGGVKHTWKCHTDFNALKYTPDQEVKIKDWIEAHHKIGCSFSDPREKSCRTDVDWVGALVE